MTMFYSNPSRESAPHALPDCEAFEVSERAMQRHRRQHPGEDGPCGITSAGWYWWPCFPGCMPDGDPVGPFATEAEAIADAQEVDTYHARDCGT